MTTPTDDTALVAKVRDALAKIRPMYDTAPFAAYYTASHGREYLGDRAAGATIADLRALCDAVSRLTGERGSWRRVAERLEVEKREAEALASKHFVALRDQQGTTDAVRAALEVEKQSRAALRQRVASMQGIPTIVHINVTDRPQSAKLEMLSKDAVLALLDAPEEA